MPSVSKQTFPFLMSHRAYAPRFDYGSLAKTAGALGDAPSLLSQTMRLPDSSDTKVHTIQLKDCTCVLALSTQMA